VADAFQRLREAAPNVEFLYRFYVVDEKRRLMGLVNVRLSSSGRTRT
jgi:Mg/Co/Ni transporter MgtE